MKNSIIKSKYIFSATTVILVILAWIILSNITKNTFVFPTFKMMLEGAKIIFVDEPFVLPYTIVSIVLAIVISFIISAVIVVIYILKKDLLGFFTPILSFIHVVPTMGITLYLFFIVKNARLIPFILVVMVTVPIIVEGLITAYDNIDKGIMDVLKLEQISFFQKLFKIYIPLMMPYILMTLMQSASLGIKALIMGEYIAGYKPGSQLTIGNILSAYQDNTGVVVFILLLLFVMSLICEIIIKILKHKINKSLIK